MKIAAVFAGATLCIQLGIAQTSGKAADSKAPAGSTATHKTAVKSTTVKTSSASTKAKPPTVVPGAGAKSAAVKAAAAKTNAAKSAAVSSKTTSHTTASASKKAPIRRPLPRLVQQQPTSDRYREIQRALADRGYFHGAVDGTWGADSMDALKRFQMDQNVDADGKISALSLIALGLGPKRESAAVRPVSSSDSSGEPSTRESGQSPPVGVQ